MATYKLKSGKYIRRGKTYQAGDEFEHFGPLPHMLKKKVECLAPDPPVPEPDAAPAHPFSVEVFGGGWYGVFDATGKKLHNANLRREDAVALASEEIVSAAERKKRSASEDPPSPQESTGEGEGQNTGEGESSGDGEGSGEQQ